MTFRAVILGVIGACFVAAVSHLNDYVAGLPMLVGNQFPTSVFGLLFVAVMLGNPVLRRLRANWAFRPPEFAVIVALMLVGCSIGGESLMRCLPPAAVMPIQSNKEIPGWRKYDLLDCVPPSMMVAGKRADSKVVDGFVRGWGEKDAPIGFSDVPWNEWSATLTTWMPLTFLIGLAVICLSLIVHRQWSRHESLRYPIADFATTLMGESPERGDKSLFRNKLFWIGMGILLAIQVVNGLHRWYPSSVGIPMQFDLAALGSKLPYTDRAWTLKTLRIYPTVIAFCFLLSSEVGLSVGISQIAYVFLAVPFVKAGIDMSGSHWSGGVNNWQRFGSYVGIALILLYTGRRYYGQVLTRAVLFRRRGEVESYAAWACRVLILSVVALVAMLWALGLAWPLAVGVVALILLMFLVMARVNAESGLYIMAPYWTPLAVLTGLFGAAALGPKAFVVIGLLSLVFSVGITECMMPFIVNGLKICDRFKVKPARVGWGATATYAIALAIAVPVILWAFQNYGINTGWFVSKNAPISVFNNAQQAAAKLSLSAQLDESVAMSGWDRITHMHPDPRFLWAAGVGLGLVVVFSVLRLRFTWWPIHPIIFVVWGTYSMGFIGYSFLIGWFIRRAVTKYGGVQKYRQVRILMFGVIAGDLLGKLIFMIVGALHYARTGMPPPPIPA